MKKMQQQEDDGSGETCSCSTWNRYLLPCVHRIQLGIFILVWWDHPELPPLDVRFEHIDTAILAELKDPAATLPRKGRPKGTPRLQTSAEVVQRTADRIEKVSRCGSCKETGHNRLRTTRQIYKMMNHLPGKTTIALIKKSRKCGLKYSPILRAESEDV
ncbi:hypothetical protein V1509DRAFT_655066 [Lipomyces kononenkoae]